MASAGQKQSGLKMTENSQVFLLFNCSETAQNYCQHNKDLFTPIQSWSGQ